MSDDDSVGAQSLAPLQARLLNYYHTQIDPDFQISDFKAISDGWETEVYAYTVTLRHQSEQVILRMYPGRAEDAADKMIREYNGMQSLRDVTHYSVPSVMYYSADTVWLGKPFLTMRKIDGQPLGQIMRDHPERFPELITRFAQLLVDLHRIDYQHFLWREAPEMQANPTDFLRLRLAFARTLILDQLKQNWATPVLDWLEAHRPTTSMAQLAVMHGDFHPWNILITAADKAYVIDWPNIEVGDDRYDLAWSLLLSGTQGTQAERDLVLSEYERISGHRVDQIEYFEVIAAVRRLLGFAVSQSVGAEAMGMRAESAAIMRNQRKHFRCVYAILQKHSGLSLPEIERLLN